jgi:hypothetical protein
MRTLNLSECIVVSGSLTQLQFGLVGAAALTGGIVTGMFAFAFTLSPLGPVIGAAAGAIALGALCAQFSPVLGTVGCGVGGSILGYSHGPIMIAAAVMYAGAAASGFFVYHKLTH